MSHVNRLLFVTDPRNATRWTHLPSAGVGLLRLDEVLQQDVGIHPLALIRPGQLGDGAVAALIAEWSEAYDDPAEYFVATIARRLARIAHAYQPRPVRVRFTDLNSAQYARLAGGHLFEPDEQRPEVGLRGAARYISSFYRPAFELECRAIKRARERAQAYNIEAIIPFCRTIAEADAVLDIMTRLGLHRGKQGFRIHVMAELPSNAVTATELAARFDGLSIGTGDLSRLVLGIDPDATALPPVDWDNPALRRFVAHIIIAANASDVPVNLCGLGAESPSLSHLAITVGATSITLRPAYFEQGGSRAAL